MSVIQPGLHSIAEAIAQARVMFPPGLVGDIAAYTYIQAPYPNATIALAGAIGIMAGICGRKYNTPTGIGLNQYLLVLAGTGRGKEAIDEAASKLFAKVVGNVVAGGGGAPCAADFRFPGHFASAEGLIKRLARTPSGFSIQGEFFAKLKAMHSAKALPVAMALRAAYLDCYNKSGDGKSLNGMAYSDKDKNIEPVISPALTLIGESTFDLLEGLDQSVISSGFLPRFMVFATEEPRPYLNPHVGTPPSPELVERMRDLAAICANYSPAQPAIRVQWNSQAQTRFAECERQATDYINANRSSAHAELWNRAFVKALKLASLIAVGNNPHAPTITLELANYAIGLVGSQIDWLTAKIENGEVGEEEGNEAKQRAHIVRIIVNFLFGDKVTDATQLRVRADHLIPQSVIQQKAWSLPAFKPRPTPAINQMIKSMVEAGELEVVSREYSLKNYPTGAKLIRVNNPHKLQHEVLSR